MELIRAIREGQVGDVIAVYSSDKGSKIDIPKWVEKAGHRLVVARDPRRLRRDRRREARGRPPCNGSSSWAAVSAARSSPTSSSRSCRRQIEAGEVDVTVVDADRPARLPAGLHVHRDGRRARREAAATRAVAARHARHARRRRGRQGRRAEPDRRSSRTASVLGYDYLVLATGSRIVPEAIEHFDDRGPPLLHAPRPRSSCGARSTRFTGGRIVIGDRRDALQVPAGAARGGVPHRGRAARARPARAERAALLLADRPRVHDRERVARWRRRSSRRRGSSCTRSSTSRRSTPSARWSRASRARSCRTTCSSSCHRTRAQQFLIDSGLAPAPGGWLPTDRETLQVGGRTNVFALGDATDLPLSKAGSTAHFEAPVVAERIVAAIQGREVDRQARRLPRQGHVLLRDRRRQGHAAPVRLRPPAAAAEAEPALAPGQDRLQQDVLAHGPQGPGLTRR